jgi:hypothetical protein
MGQEWVFSKGRRVFWALGQFFANLDRFSVAVGRVVAAFIARQWFLVSVLVLGGSVLALWKVPQWQRNLGLLESRQWLVPIIQSLITVVGVGLTAVITLLIASWKVRDALEEAYDKELRSHRINSYLKLWAVLEPFARYPRPAELTYSCLIETSTKLRAWYFNEGGLFLSEATREAYFKLQDILKAILDKHEDVSLFALADLKSHGRSMANMLARAETLASPDARKDSVAKYLYSQLSEKTQNNLRQHRRCLQRLLRKAPELSLRRDLIDVLNRQLGHPELYRNLVRLQHCEADPAKEPSGTKLRQANRALLEKEYGEEIIRVQQAVREPKVIMQAEGSGEILDPRRCADLVATASNLRTTITDDVLTRRKSRIG